MISLSTGYDFIEPDQCDIDWFMNELIKIHPDEEIRKCYLSILARSLEGNNLQHFIIFNGSGGNGKSMLDNLHLVSMGQYGYTFKSGILSKTLGQGACPEIANLHMKRFVVAKGVNPSIRLNNSIIKDLTGGGEINARMLYQNSDQVKLSCTFVCECNAKPGFQSDAGKAEERRIIDLPFQSEFTNNESLVDPDNHIYPADPSMGSNEFINKFKHVFLRILFNTYKETKGEIYLPDKIRSRTIAYLTQSHFFFRWFLEEYQQTTDSSEPYLYYLPIEDLVKRFRLSESYNNLSKEQKQLITRNYLIGIFQKNDIMRKYYRENVDTIIYNNRYHKRNVICGWKTINDDTSILSALNII